MKDMCEKNYWIHAVSPLHIGTGRGIGYIDLPIAREKVTGWPYIPGSAVKGVIADYFGADLESRKNDASSYKKAAFGLASSDFEATENAGSIVFSDAVIVCLPVRSFYGTFAWITSPFALARIKRAAKLEIPEVKTKECALVCSDNSGSDNSVCANGDKIYLEDIDLNVDKNELVSKWAELIAGRVFSGNKDWEEWQEIFIKRFVVVDDNIFTFLCETGTEVNARIMIKNELKTAAEGALWYEESLPVETILSGIVWCDKVYEKKEEISPKQLMNKFCNGELQLQLGGKASIGKGIVRCIFYGGEQ